MNIKTLVMGMVIGGIISTGTYFLLPPPHSVEASRHLPIKTPQSYYELNIDNVSQLFVMEWRLKNNPNILCVSVSTGGLSLDCINSPQ